jgi:hypothetical protein
MWMDAVDLRDFYATGQGRVARLMIRRQIRAIWPDVTGKSVLGMGYATPYLGMFRDEAFYRPCQRLKACCTGREKAVA